MIAKLIQKHIKNINIVLLGASNDPRDYIVNFDKLKKIYNYAPKFSLKYGIKEFLNQLKRSNFINRNLYKDKLGNYQILQK